MDNKSYSYTGCYGKLPFHGDFIRYRASSVEIHTFDHWLQEGMSIVKNRLAERWIPAWESASNIFFVFPCKDSDQLLLGCLKTSQDKIDRKFPFIITLLLPLDVFDRRETIYAPLLFQTFFNHANRILSADLNQSSLEELYQEIDHIPESASDEFPKIMHSYSEFKNNTTIDNFFTYVFGNFDNRAKFLLFKNILGAAAQLKDADIEAVSGGFQIPLSRKKTYDACILCYWQEILMHLFKLDKVIAPYTLWHEIPTYNCLYEFFYLNYPPPKLFINLVDHDFANDIVFKIDKDGMESIDRIEDEMPQEYVNLLENRTLTLTELLARLCI